MFAMIAGRLQNSCSVFLLLLLVKTFSQADMWRNRELVGKFYSTIN